MSRFSIAGRIQFLDPNLSQFVTKANRQLQGITANIALNTGPAQAQIQKLQRQVNTLSKGSTINLNVNTSGLSNLNRQLTTVNNTVNKTTQSFERFGRQAGDSIQRFGAYTVATVGFYKFVNAIQAGIKEAVDYQKELNKIRQVSGTSIASLSGLSNEVTRLSKTYGVASEKILNTAQVLAQAGLSFKDTQIALEALAKTELAPTFDNIENSVEGAIAIMSQFGTSAADLNAQFGSINSAAGKFAIESSDVITAVRRTGGAFRSAGGDLNELIALLTSVRATTRESAESISTGFRTIFTRLQRTRTIDFLKTLGIDTTDTKGLFAGPYKAIQAIGRALKDIPDNDPRFSQIIEELGGFRQVSKVIPLIKQLALQEQALGVAIRGTNSLNEDSVKGLDTLANQIERTREEFKGLVRSFSETDSFNSAAKLFFTLASSLITVTNSIKEVVPALGLLGLYASGPAIAGFGRGFASIFTGGKNTIRKNTGGTVPGTGNTDKVPAMLTPGEFVMKKSAVQKIGVDRLHKMNSGVQYFADGGLVKDNKKAALRLLVDKTGFKENERGSFLDRILANDGKYFRYLSGGGDPLDFDSLIFLTKQKYDEKDIIGYANYKIEDYNFKDGETKIKFIKGSSDLDFVKNQNEVYNTLKDDIHYKLEKTYFDNEAFFKKLTQIKSYKLGKNIKKPIKSKNTLFTVDEMVNYISTGTQPNDITDQSTFAGILDEPTDYADIEKLGANYKLNKLNLGERFFVNNTSIANKRLKALTNRDNFFPILFPFEKTIAYNTNAGASVFKDLPNELKQQLQGLYDSQNVSHFPGSILEHSLNVSNAFGSPDLLDKKGQYVFGLQHLKFNKSLAFLHDIGKPLATNSVGGHKQYDFTLPLVKQILGDKFTPRKLSLMEDLIKNDFIGKYIQNGDVYLSRTVADIKSSAEKHGLNLESYYKYLKQFYQADAGDYPDIKKKLFENGELKQSAAFDNLEIALGIKKQKIAEVVNSIQNTSSINAYDKYNLKQYKKKFVNGHSLAFANTKKFGVTLNKKLGNKILERNIVQDKGNSIDLVGSSKEIYASFISYVNQQIAKQFGYVKPLSPSSSASSTFTKEVLPPGIKIDPNVSRNSIFSTVPYKLNEKGKKVLDHEALNDTIINGPGYGFKNEKYYGFNFGNKTNKYTQDEINAIKAYSGSYSGEMFDALNNDKGIINSSSSTIIKYVKNLKSAAKKSKSVAPTKLYHGERHRYRAIPIYQDIGLLSKSDKLKDQNIEYVMEQFKNPEYDISKTIGKEIRYKPFISASYDEDVAKTFGSFFIMKFTPKRTKAGFIKGIPVGNKHSVSPGESEIIIPENSRFRIDAAKIYKGTYATRPYFEATQLNKGGTVPGSGNTDTVPAMLTPGEFVLNKRAVQKIGVNKLRQMNEVQKFNTGGLVIPTDSQIARNTNTFSPLSNVSTNANYKQVNILASEVDVESKGKLSGITDNFKRNAFIGGLGGTYFAQSAIMNSLSDSTKELVGQFTALTLQTTLFYESLKTISDRNLGPDPGFGNSKNLTKELTDLSQNISELEKERDTRQTTLNRSRRVVKVAGQLEDSINNRSNYITTLNNTLSNAGNLGLTQQQIIKLTYRRDKQLEKLKDVQNKRIQIGALKPQLVNIAALTEMIQNDNENLNLSRNRSSELKDQIAQQKAYEKSVRNNKIANIGLGIAFAGAGVGSSFLLDKANKQLTNFEKTGVGAEQYSRNFVTSKSLSSAANFGAVGAAAGSLFGPLGTVIGGAGGGVIGALYGFMNATKEAEINIRRVNNQRSFTEFGKILTGISSDTADFRKNISYVSTTLQSFAEKQRTETDASIREDISGALQNSANDLQIFINKVVDSSSSIEQFNRTINQETLRIFANISNLPFQELVDNLNKKITDKIKAETSARSITAANRDFENRVNFQNSLSKSLDRNDKKNQIGNIQNLSGNRSLSTFAGSLFGDTGRQLADNADASSRAKDLIPGILLNLRQKDPLAEGDLLTTLRDQIIDADIPTFIRDKIIANAQKAFGADLKEANLIEKIRDDFNGAISEVVVGLDNFGNSLAAVESKVNSRLNEFGDGLLKYNESLLALISSSLKVVDINEKGLRFNAGFSGNEVDFTKLRSLETERQKSFGTSVLGVNNVLNALQGQRTQQLGLQTQLENESDPLKLKTLQTGIAQTALNISKLSQQLEFLADATSRAAVLEEQLNLEKTKRELQKEQTSGLIFGGKEQRLEFAKTVQDINNLINSGFNIDAVREDRRGQVENLLKQNANIKLLGTDLTGQQIIDKTLAKAGVKADVIGPNEKEKTLAQQINEVIGQSEAAQKGLIEQQKQDAGKFITDLTTAFDKFIADLRETTLNQLNSADNQAIAGKQGDLNNLIKQRSTINNLQTFTGLDVNILRNVIPQIETFRKSQKELQDRRSQADVSKFLIKENSTLIPGGEFPTIQETFLNKEDINKKLSELVGKLSSTPELQDEIFKQIQGNAFAKVAKESDFNNVLRKIFKDINNTTDIKTVELAKQRANIVNNIGEDKFNRINSGAFETLKKDIGGIPENTTSLNLLNNSIQKLELEIQKLNLGIVKRAKGFATGGFVGGVGSGDTVPAMLTPGEFVMRKEAVQRIGIGNLNQMNVQKFANGGLVTRPQSQNVTIHSDLNNSIAAFGNYVNQLQGIFEKIPNKIEIEANHTVEVLINGAQVIAELDPQIRKLVVGETQKAINNMLKSKFPEVGPM